MSLLKLVSIPNFTMAKTPVFSDFEHQLDYFNSLPIIFEKESSYLPDQPMIINPNNCIGNIDEATHAILFHDRRYIFYRIIDFAYNSATQVTLNVERDEWLTYKEQYNIKLGSGKLQRRGGDKPYYQPTISGVKFSLENFQTFYNMGSEAGSQIGAIAVAWVKQGATDEIEYSLLPFTNQNNINNGVEHINSGRWVYHVGINNPADIINAWFVPFHIQNELINNSDWTLALGPPSIWYRYDANNYPLLNLSHRTTPNWFKTDEFSRAFIIDHHANIVYDCPPQLDMSNKMILQTLDFSPNSCRIECAIDPEFGYPFLNSTLDRHFTFHCEPLDVMRDEWAIYNAGQRQIDINMRAIQRKQQQYSTVGSAASMGGIGGLFGLGQARQGGGFGGVGIGMVAGFFGTLLGGVFEELGYRSTDPQIQANLDKGKQLETNVELMSKIGCANIITRFFTPTYIKITVDDASKERFLADYNENGWEVDEVYEDCEELLQYHALQGDVEIIGAIPLFQKLSISNKIKQGLRIVHPEVNP